MGSSTLEEDQQDLEQKQQAEALKQQEGQVPQSENDDIRDKNKSPDAKDTIKSAKRASDYGKKLKGGNKIPNQDLQEAGKGVSRAGRPGGAGVGEAGAGEGAAAGTGAEAGAGAAAGEGAAAGAGVAGAEAGTAAAGAGTAAAGTAAAATATEAAAGTAAAAGAAEAAAAAAGAIAATEAAAAGAGVAGLTSEVWVPILIAAILLLFVIAILAIIILQVEKSQNNNSNAYNPLSITKTGPTTAKIGDILNYSITVTYNGTAKDVQIQDPLPAGTTYISSSWILMSQPAAQNPTLNWSVLQNKKEPNACAEKVCPPPPTTVSNVNETFTFKLRATKNNTNIVNVATATVIGPIAAGSGCGNFDKNATDFDQFFAGQGRCTNVLGNENQFVQTAINNAGSQLGFAGDTAQLQAIYTTAVAQKVNPVIVLSDWGVQSSFGNATGGFGCNSNGGSFAGQLNCEVSTFNYWMNNFTKQNMVPVDIPQGNAACPYTDEFVYAYEYMTPVCHFADQNQAARGNLMKFYKMIIGI